MLDDLNLLKVFEALWIERNVSRAGKRLALGQPAMSARLNKLRQALGDPVFVRQLRGLTPTPRALMLAPSILNALEICKNITTKTQVFDPLLAKGRIVISGTDYFDLLAMPTLIPRIAREAPDIQVVTRTLRGEFPKEELENGSLDIAVAGFFQNLPEGFFRQKIFAESYACAVRKEHPQVKSSLSKRTFLALAHLLISPQGDLNGAVDQVLAKEGLKRKVVAGVGNFHAPGAIIANSDLILTAPRQLLNAYGEHLPIKILEPPFKIPGFSAIQIWHERTNQDPLRSWIRKLICEISTMVWPQLSPASESTD
jgi:DNA-binding transcriptional LysR family regulator